MRLKAGDSFDRYTIEELLGEGGMGEVYRAMDAKLRRRVALKVLRRSPDDAETWQKAVARMLREARAAAALNHPGAVSIFDVGELDGVPYLAMELIEGASLRRLVGGDAPATTRVRWLCDIARALAAAHRAGLVHRDIKPENVMLRDDGVIKVLDFGIARGVRLAVDASGPTVDGGTATVTNEGSFVGTPAYMAPEQIRGDPFDGRADQFAWGVLAFELLCGRLPFGEGRDALGILAAVLGQDTPPLTGVPDTVAAVIRRALSKEPEDRFATMDEVADALSEMVTLPERVVAAGAEGAAAGEHGRRAAVEVTPGNAGAITVVARPRRGLLRPILVAAAVVAAAGVTIAVTVLSPVAPVEEAAAPSASAAPAPAPTPITDTEPPRSHSQEALSAYREGLQGFRDAAWPVAHESFQRAVALDPAFAAGYLRLAMTSHYLATTRETRDAFQKAVQLRAKLGERDQALLEVMEPFLQRDPADGEEARRRLEAARRRYPGDAELAHLALSFPGDGRSVTQLEVAERCLVIDPLYADCWQAKALALDGLQRTSEARDALDRCLEVSPSALDCLISRAYLNDRDGQCRQLEQDARALLAKSPHSAEAYRLLAAALHATGRPVPSVRFALQQASHHDPEPVKKLNSIRHDISLALISGRFLGAEKLALDIRRSAALTSDGGAHMMPAMYLIEIYRDTGRVRDAGEVAHAMLTMQPAWNRPLRSSVWADRTVEFLSIERRAGMLSEEQFEARRLAWIQSWRDPLPAEVIGAVWMGAYAAPARTAAEARVALETMPDIDALQERIYSSYNESATMGRLYWLAGRQREALPHLIRAAGSCAALEWPVPHTIANYQLGEALAATGDTAGACRALKVVLERWGGEKRSITAQAAATRWRALGCAD